MPRYLFKIPLLALGELAPVLDEACTILNTVEDTTISIPGVSIRNAEIALDKDSLVNAEFWLVRDVTKVDFEEAMKGSDGILLFVDPASDPSADTTLEYLNILERSIRFLPVMITIVNAAGQATLFDDGFIRKVWEHRVVECMTLSQAAIEHFSTILKVLLNGIIQHPDAGPVNLEGAWLRSGIAWQIMSAKIEQDLKQIDKIFLGRTFYMLSIVAKEKKRLESLVLGAIGARWLEMATEYMLAARICEQLGEKARAYFLKQKHLQFLVNQATAFVNQHKFEEAALKFQEGAFWNRNEFVDISYGEDLFIKAIDAWVSIFEFEKIPDLLGQIKSPASYLATLKEKITRGIDYLVKQELLEKANFQLDTITKIYLKHDLRESATELAKKQVQIKLAMLKDKVEQQFIGDSLLLVDELVAVRDHMNIPVSIPDQQLAAICAYLTEAQSYHELEKIIPLVQDQLLVKQLSARRVAKEKETEIESREKKEALKKSAYQRLLVYFKEQQEDALLYAKSRRKILFDIADQGNPDRAASFLKINAQWLRDLDHTDIASDLVFQVMEHLVKGTYLLDVSGLIDFLPDSKQEALMNIIAQNIQSKSITVNDLYFSSVIEHYQNQARTNNFHAQADALATCLAQALLQEARLASKDKNADAIKVATAKLDKFKLLLSLSEVHGKVSTNVDDILENLIQFHIDSNDLTPVEDLMNQLVDLDKKRRFTARLVQISQEQALSKEDEYKKQEESRVIHEELLELKRLLLLNQPQLAGHRDAREELLKAWKNDKKIPEQLTCFVTDPDALLKPLDKYEKNQQVATQFFLKSSNAREIALSAIASQLLALKRNDTVAITNILGIIEKGSPEVKSAIEEEYGWKLALLLVKAIHLEMGADIGEAIMLMELLPLINGERFLIYKVLHKPVPESVKVKKEKPPADEFEKKIDDALPVIAEMTCMEFEPVQMALLARRQVLEREGKLYGLPYLVQKKFDKAALFYQDEAFRFFDAGDILLGWTSLWISIMIMAREHVDVKEISAVFKNITTTYKGNETIGSHCMTNAISMFLRCIEKKIPSKLQDFKSIFDSLPLLDKERELFDTNALKMI
nr:hypothetical protein [Candidatus Sigynarchaeota archaeon]